MRQGTDVSLMQHDCMPFLLERHHDVDAIVSVWSQSLRPPLTFVRVNYASCCSR